MAAPAVQSLEEIIASLDPAYSQQKNVYSQQIAALPGQEAGAILGLNTAKSNAFREVNRAANAKGLAFSGIPIEEQTRYLGEKYLPGLAEVKKSTQNQTFQLQQALAGLDTEQRLRAMETRSGQQKSLEGYLEAERQREFEMRKMREQMTFERGQSASKQKDLEIRKNSRGGWEIYVNGQKTDQLDLAGYARETGTDLVSLLSQGDADDRRAAQYYMDKIRKYGTAEAAKYMLELQRDRPTAFYRGG